MFESLNLFKSINCPYYSAQTNSITCERPYCQFFHLQTNQSKVSQSKVEKFTLQSSLSSSSIDLKFTNTSDNKKNENKSESVLPDALENLTNALQTVQELFKSTQQALNENPQSHNKLADQINSLSSVITSISSSSLSKSSTNLPSSQSVPSNLASLSNKSPVQKKPSAKRPPDYNPTPISELKKLKQEITNKLTKPIEKEETKNEKKSLPNVKESETKEKDDSCKSEEKPKFDFVSFSKMSLSQQVMKRYELMNKEPPPIRTSPAASKTNVKKTSKESSSTATNKQVCDTPRLIVDSGPLRIPMVIRQRYLNLIFENGRSLFATVEKACEKAAEQEKSIYDRSKTKNVYLNLAANLIKNLRTQQDSSKGTKTTENSSGGISHEAMLSGPKGNYSINRIKQIQLSDLSSNQLYDIFLSYILTDKQLEENSFPKWSNVEKTLAFIPNFKIKAEGQVILKNSKLIVKKCKRCSSSFEILNDNFIYAHTNSECVFHWGKLRNMRIAKAIEQKYSCCNGDTSSIGCEVGKHVYDGDYDGNGLGKNLTDYVETLKSNGSKTSNDVYALDCEMCYTTKGLQLARVSLIDINCKTVYDAIVKPDAQILDYNTRWSGLTERSFENCNKDLAQIQKDLLGIIHRDTILIGHSLESDFKALKLIHTNVVDTSVVFPHKLGLPYKRALRNLMSEYLQKVIQEDADGHDSQEDASACIQLMIWKINEDLKTKKKSNLISSSVVSTASGGLASAHNFNTNSPKNSTTVEKTNTTLNKLINNSQVVKKSPISNSSKI